MGELPGSVIGAAVLVSNAFHLVGEIISQV